MRAEKFSFGINPNSPNQRWRKYGIIACLFGVGILSFIVVTLHLFQNASIILYLAAIPAAILLLVTAISCWINYHVKAVLFCVLLSLYSTVWVFGYLEMTLLRVQIHATALYLFIPLLVVSMMNHRAIFALAPVQFVLVFHATTIYISEFYAPDVSTSQNMLYVAGITATMSALSFVMTALISMIRDQSDRNLLKVIDEKKALANTDALTGLPNRRSFFESLNALWQKDEPFVLAYIDLMQFKPLNDQYGHAAGDAVLKELAARMTECEKVHIAARLGGDEFAVVFSGNVRGQERANSAVEDLHTIITSDFPSKFGVLSVGASIGYVEAREDVTSLPLLTAAADTAMRRARAKRVNCVRFNEAIDGSSLTISAVEVAFKNALRSGQIRAAIHPIASAATREIVGYELLSRWTNSGFAKDPTPDQFIPVAEKLGLLNELLWKTLEETLSHLNLQNKKLSVNVSPGQLTSSDFLRRLTNILLAHDVSTHSIILEVTEQIAFRNLDRNVEVLRQARELGLQIALDDFGTGYASLSIVDALPLDKLKIDRSFVRSTKSDARRDAILGAAIQMCRELDLVCCVEGIETGAVADSVAALGVDEIQGYLLGYPCLVSEIPELHLVA